MKRQMLILALLLAGCPAHVHRGAWVAGQDGQTLNTQQTCQRSAEAIRAADIALPIMLQLYEQKGYCKDYEAWQASAAGHLSVCIIDQPEQCHPSMPWPRHGCADTYNVVQSIRWPPICQPGMPDALKCVKTQAEQRLDWERNFVHELTNLVLQRCGIYDPSYKHPARELEPGIWQRYQAARGDP